MTQRAGKGDRLGAMTLGPGDRGAIVTAALTGGFDRDFDRAPRGRKTPAGLLHAP